MYSLHTVLPYSLPIVLQLCQGFPRQSWIVKARKDHASIKNMLTFQDVQRLMHWVIFERLLDNNIPNFGNLWSEWLILKLICFSNFHILFHLNHNSHFVWSKNKNEHKMSRQTFQLRFNSIILLPCLSSWSGRTLDTKGWGGLSGSVCEWECVWM